MVTLVFNSLWSRRRRVAGIAVAIALGVAFLTGTLVLGDTLGTNFERLFNDASAGTDVVVRNATEVKPGGAPDSNRGLIDEALVDTIRRVDGVAHAEGQVVGYGSLLGADGKAIGGNGPPRQAGSWIESTQLNPYRLVEGRPPARAGEVVINRGAARAGHLRLGDRTVVQTPDPVPVTIVGIATFGDADGIGQTTWTAFTLPEAQAVVTHQPGEVTNIVVTAHDGVPADVLRDRIASVLPPNAQAITGKALAAERISQIDSTFLDTLRAFLVVFALIALAVASVSIHNTFAITVAQRSRELALLRAVGASRRQVRAAVTLEAITIGIVAGVVGLAAGLGIAGLLKGLFDAFGGALPAGGLDVRPRALLIAIAAGVIAAVLAAQAAARRASRVEPVEAMRDAEAESSRPPRRRSVVAGCAAVVGVAGAFAGPVANNGILSALGAVGLVVAALSAAPILLTPAVRVLDAATNHALGARAGSIRLAIENTRRNPRRSASTATALVIGVAIVALFTVFAASMKQTLGDRIGAGFEADLAVNTARFGGSQLSPRITDELRSVPGVARVVGVGEAPALVGGESTTVTATDPGQLTAVVGLDVRQGSLAAVGPDGIAISRSKADERGWRLDDPVPVTFNDGKTVPVVIRAIYEDSPLVAGVVMPATTWDQHDAQPTYRTVYLTTGSSATATASQMRAAVEGIAQRYGGSVQDRSEFTAASTRGLDMLLGIVYVLLALAIVIALLGIGNTLALAVHERRREIGLLRAVGQTRSQTRTVLRVEAVIVSAFGTVLGLVLGTALGWVLFASVARMSPHFALPVGRLVVIAVLGATAGALAAVRPARRAARLPVLEAIAAG